VAELFDCRSLGTFTLKGKEKEVAVYEVVGHARSEAAPAPGAAAREA
jgi:class 3 adenylate cyclase